MEAVGKCVYCPDRAVHLDHLISKNQARRRVEAWRARENPRYKLPTCFAHNMRKYTFNRVPPSHAHLIPELEEITGNAYAVWDGEGMP